MTSPPAALAALFSRAVQAIQNLPPAGPTDAGLAPTNTEKLEFYALYKQATTGPLDAATTKRPGFFDPVGRAKYDTWLGKVRLTRAEAMRAYTDLFMAFLRRFPDRPQAVELLATFVGDGALAPSASASEYEDDLDDESDVDLHHRGSDSDSDPDEDRRTAIPGAPERNDSQQLPADLAAAAHARRRASIATMETGQPYFSASEGSAGESNTDDDSEDSDGDGNDVPFAARTGLDASMVHVHRVPRMSSVVADDTRSIASAATVRPPPVVTTSSSASTTSGRPSSPRRGTVIGPNRPPVPALPSSFALDMPVVPATAATAAQPIAASSGIAVADPLAARLRADLDRETERARRRGSPSTIKDVVAAADPAARSSGAVSVVGSVLKAIRWALRLLATTAFRAALAWLLLATVGRALRARQHPIYLLLVRVVRAALGAPQLVR